MQDARPLVMHVVYRFDVGGLENGVVNLINHMPAERFRHAVVSLTDCSEAFCRRVRRDDERAVCGGRNLDRQVGRAYPQAAAPKQRTKTV